MFILDISPFLQTIMNVVFSTGTVGAIILLIRYRRRDSATANKTDAEAEKVKMDAYAVKTAADITIADAYLKLIQRMTEDGNMTKIALDKAQKDLEDANRKLMEATIKLNKTQDDLNNEKQKATLREEEIITLKRELEELKGNKK